MVQVLVVYVVLAEVLVFVLEIIVGLENRILVVQTFVFPVFEVVVGLQHESL